MHIDTIRVCSFACLLSAVACGGEKKETPSMQPTPAAEPAKGPAPSAQPAPAEQPAMAPSAPLKAGDDGVVHLYSNDKMRYVAVAQNEMLPPVNRIEVKAGKIKIELKNVGVLPKEVMGHDFVLLKQGKTAMEFAQKAITAKATDYIPADSADDMVGHTKLLGPGETETLELDLQAGSYPFLCTFPGHVGMMSGQLVAQ